MRDGQLHLLLVDDDEIDREMVVRCLRPHRHHFTVTATAGAREALHILCGEAGHRRLLRPYAIVLELCLPGMDGFEFLQEYDKLDAEHKGAKIFMLSSSLDPTDFKKSIENKYITQFIHKPLTHKILEELSA